MITIQQMYNHTSQQSVLGFSTKVGEPITVLQLGYAKVIEFPECSLVVPNQGLIQVIDPAGRAALASVDSYYIRCLLDRLDGANQLFSNRLGVVNA